MTCSEARILTAFRRPGELTPADAAALDRHLAGCPECAAAAGGESAFDAAIGRVLTAVPVPAGLKANLHAAAGQTIAAARWRRLGRTAAGLAALVVTVALGASLYLANRPALDLEGLALRHDVDGRERHAKQWLLDNGLPTTLANFDFDFSLCTGYGTEDLQGRSVPVLLFQDPKNPVGFAKVYIVRDGKFNMKLTPEQGGSSFVTALKVPGGPDTPRITFIILHTGDLKLFLRSIPNPL